MSADTVIVPTALPVGYVLNGTYAIVSVLGQGGFGITYLATELTTQRQVVIKENYPAQLVYREPGQYRIAPCGAEAEFSYKAVLQSFIDEARVLTHLRHPHIVQVLTAFQTLGTAYYVMDYVGGRPLHNAAPSSEKITEEWLLSVMKPLLCALQYLHTLPRPLLHRDIKPNNILLLPDGSPVLIDFGLAREAAAGPTSMLAAYTPGYSPLEQNSRAKRGPWSDLYALGATCYCLLTGENPPDCHERTDDDPYRPLSQRPELSRRFSPAVLAGIDRALRMPRHERWQTAQDWLDSLYGKQAAAEVVSGSKSRPRRGKAVFAAALLLLAAAGTVSYYQGFVSEPDKRTVNEMNMSRIMSIMIQDVRLENTPIEDVLDFLRGEARKYGLTLNFVYNDSAVPPGTPQPIVSNLALQAVSIKEFLHYVCLKANCQYRVEDGAIVITPVVSGNQPQPQPEPEPVEPAALPEESVEPAPLPAVEPVGPEALPAVEPVEPAALPAVESVEPATLPAVEPVGPEALPAVEPVGPEALPAVEPVGPEALPAVEPVEPAGWSPLSQQRCLRWSPMHRKTGSLLSVRWINWSQQNNMKVWLSD